MRGIVKSFGPVQALRGADFSLAPAEIHALLGENGAGKTTLMHVLFGRLRADEGIVEVNGASARIRSSADALALGIGMVPQHHAHVARMTVAENVALGRGGFRTDLAAARRLVTDISSDTGLPLDPDAPAGTLSVALSQRLEIIRALSREARVLILDEPTSALAPQETATLLDALRRLRSRGVSIVLITHKLDDALGTADRVTVLRQGRTVATATTRETTAPALAAAMIGEAPAPARDAAAAFTAPADTILDIAVGGERLIVRGGEIVGIAAVEGNGQRELLRSIAEHHQGVAFIPEDRQREGLIPDFSIEENLALGQTASWRVDRQAMRRAAQAAIAEYGITAGTPTLRAGALSGGNQQKVVLARALAGNPRVLVAENPTRGLDLHATAFVHARLRHAAAAGCAVLFHSSDLDEVLQLAQRIVVMHQGAWREMPAAERTRERIGAAMLGLS